ncbi:MAG TPA: hypothetical protein VGH28_02860 [Polyangiaceae bacterium]
MAAETIEEVSLDSLVPLAIAGALALAAAVVVGDALHAMHRGRVRMRRRARIRRIRRSIRHILP